MVETRRAPYTSPVGFRTDILPWRLWEKAKKNFWDPADIDFSQDTRDWESLTQQERNYVAFLAGRFMVGEEAVTIDIVPLLRAVSEEGRLEETMFLTTFAMEEAKHIDFFRRWFDAIGLTQPLHDLFGPYRGIIHDILPQVMSRLDTDRSPEAVLDAALTYNQVIEGVLAIAGYKIWERIFTQRGIMPGLREGLKLVQQDERRHIAYGTYLCRRIVSEHPELWPFAKQRIEFFRSLIAGGPGLEPQNRDGGYAGATDGPFGFTFEVFTEYAMPQFSRRLEVIEVAVGMRPEDVETDHAVEDLEDELERA